MVLVDKDKGFKRLMRVSEALELMLSKVDGVDGETIDVRDSQYRILYKDIISSIDVPPFDRAAMDGYAVRSIDVSGASPSNPIRLRVVGSVKTSSIYRGILNSGEAVRIDTGAPMPKGADAVVMVEDTEYRDGYIDVYRAVSPKTNVSIRGEDIKRGETLFRRGHLLHPFDVAVLISIGLERVEVYRRVRVSLASIGRELRDIGEDLGESGVRETNRIMIRGLLAGLPVEFMRSRIISDDPDDISMFIDESIKDSDLIITTGGTSLGKGDTLTDYIYDIGEVYVHGVALQPSKPVLFSIIRGTPHIGLPGYPVAAAISTELFVKPIILKMAGLDGRWIPKIVKARLARRTPSKTGLLHAVRCRVSYRDGEYIAEPIYGSGAGVLTSLSRANGLLFIPENIEGFEEGSTVDIYLFRDVISDE